MHIGRLTGANYTTKLFSSKKSFNYLIALALL